MVKENEGSVKRESAGVVFEVLDGRIVYRVYLRLSAEVNWG